MEKKLDTKAAADYLGYENPQTLANWRHQGRGPIYHKVMGKIFYFEKDLQNFQNSGRIIPENN